MPMLEEVGQYLSEKFASLIIGRTLFLGQLPDAPDDAVGLYELAGLPDFTLGAEPASPHLPQFVTHRLHIEVRRSDLQTAFPDAQNVAIAIWQSLMLTEVTLNGTRYMSFDSVDSPAAIDEDKQRRITFGCNFVVMRENTVGDLP